MIRFFVCLASIFFLSACSPISTPVSTFTQLPPTEIITPTFISVPTSTSVPTETQEPLSTSTLSPTATSKPALTSQEIIALTANKEQMSPEEIVQAIRNGETLIPKDALTDEFLELYLKAMTWDRLKEFTPMTTVGDLEGFTRNLGWNSYQDRFNMDWFYARLDNNYVSQEDIHIFNDESMDIYAIGFLRFSWTHPITGQPVSALAIVTTQKDDIISIIGRGRYMDDEGLQNNQGSEFFTEITQGLKLWPEDLVFFGLNHTGENFGSKPYRNSNNEILKKMYPNWQEALAILKEGNTNAVPILPLSELIKPQEAP